MARRRRVKSFWDDFMPSENISPKNYKNDKLFVSDLVEKIAALEHEQWMAWSQDIALKEPISESRRKRWSKLWKPFSDLSEDEKEQDRIWARKVVALFYIELNKSRVD